MIESGGGVLGQKILEAKVDFGQKYLLGIFPCDLDDNDEEEDVNDLIIKDKGILSGIDVD